MALIDIYRYLLNRPVVTICWYNADKMTIPFLNRTTGHGVTPLGGAADLFSSAIDMAKWMLFVLADGKTPDGVSLIPEFDMQLLEV